LPRQARKSVTAVTRLPIYKPLYFDDFLAAARSAVDNLPAPLAEIAPSR
jgi:hypothetical protein